MSLLVAARAASLTPRSLRSPYYTASHRAFRARVRAFVDAEVTPHCDAWDRQKAIPRELFAKAFAAGLLPGVVGPPWPEAYAGPGPEVRMQANKRASARGARRGRGAAAAAPAVTAWRWVLTRTRVALGPVCLLRVRVPGL